MNNSKIFKKAFYVIIYLLFVSSVFAQDGSELIDRVFYNDFESVKELVKNGVDVNYQDEELAGLPGSTGLIVASIYGYVDIAKFLIDSGADVNIQAQNGTTALMGAVYVSKELVEYLLSKGADIHAEMEDGTTVFTFSVIAVMDGRMTLDLPKLFLDKGADVDEAPPSGPEEGYTCLMMAARNNKPELVKFLVENGADINAKAKDGSTSLSLAMEENDTEMVKLMNNPAASYEVS